MGQILDNQAIRVSLMQMRKQAYLHREEQGVQAVVLLIRAKLELAKARLVECPPNELGANQGQAKAFVELLTAISTPEIELPVDRKVGDE